MDITNDQLRMQVALALGYIDNGVANDDAHEFYLLSAEGRQYFYINGLPGADASLPNWPEDIAAAMGLATLMAIANTVVIRLYHNLAWVSVADRQYLLTSIASGSADKPARAISLAFIAWKQAQS